MVGSGIGSSPEHVPVLLDEVLKNLIKSEAGTYVDATFGRGGHTRALLQALAPAACVVACDRDPRAVEAAQGLAVMEPRLQVRHARFSLLAQVLRDLRVASVDGVLMDLGVSSPQLDTAQRGFSFRHDGPLDMRMNPDEGESAAAWLNRAAEADIADVIKTFGEERHARRIAHAIVAARPLTQTGALAELVAAVVPRRGQTGKHPATRTFQAIRMFINEELHELDAGLQAAFDALTPGGRLAVISFHSLEDRRVKQFFRSLTQPPAVPRGVPLRAHQMGTQARSIAGPVRPTVAELQTNTRARSATLRVIEKVTAGGAL